MVKSDILLGSRLRQLRLAEGYSLDELATAMGGLVTKQALSKYETGKSQPSQGVLNKLASTLGVKASSLSSRSELKVSFHGFRKRAKLRIRSIEEIQSRASILLEQRVHLQPFYRDTKATKVPFQSFKVASVKDAEIAAREMRQLWALGDAPIADVTNTLEEHCVHVLELSETEHFDGLSATAHDESKKAIGSAVVTCFETSGERQRFNLAHELAHLVMSVQGDINEEAAANRFAGAFLAPRSTLISLTGIKRHHLTLSELLILKRRLGMSLQALLYRMKDLHIISETLHRHWCIEVNKHGWRKQEPEPLPREEPRWFRRAVIQSVTEHWITREEGQQLLGEKIDTLEPLTLEERRAFMKRPLQERRRIMATQAEELADHYRSDNEWKDLEGVDFVEY